MSYHNQSIAVLGLGSSGEAAALLLLEQGANVTVLDTGDPAKLAGRSNVLVKRGVKVVTGDAALENVASYNKAVISPGIDPCVPLVQQFIQRNIPIISEIELAFEFCHCPVIAITGTNGKTTTTGLIAAMLNEAGRYAVPAGNFGTPFSEIVGQSRTLDYVVLEVSSFQLEAIKIFRPLVSVWMNFAPDHLDRYSDVQSYRDAKLRIFENQTTEDFAIVNARDGIEALAAKRITFNALAPGADFELHDEHAIFFRDTMVIGLSETQLRGTHNAENLMAALGVAHVLKLPFEQAKKGLCRYRAMPHRCELVGERNGVTYLNDSKATNLDALEKALLSQTCPVVLIAGGKDKGFGFESLTDLVASRVKKAILIGEMQEKISLAWQDKVVCEKTDTLANAVALATAAADSGDVVLLSPGTSSYDMFKSYEDRGNQFRTLVQNIITHT